MNSMEFDVIKSLVENKKYSAITEYSRIVNPNKEDIIVTEYTGSDVTVYKDDRGNVRLLCPKHMDYVQEGHVAQAIANGTIFDDATDVDNNATMIERTSLPYDAMINEGRPTPKHLKPMIAIIIGKMDRDGSCAVSDADRTNGVNFIKDLCCKATPERKTVHIVGHWIGKSPQDFYTPEMGKSITQLDKEVDNIRDTNPESCISDDDTCESYADYDMNKIESGSTEDDDDNSKDDSDYDKLDEDDDSDNSSDDDENESDDEDEDSDDTDMDDDMDDADSDDDNDDEDFDVEDDIPDVDDDDDNEDEDENEEINECGDGCNKPDAITEHFNYILERDAYYIQEGVFKSLKKIGYNPKTKTMITDIPAVNKPGKKVRCSVRINDMISQMHGPCISGNIEKGDTPIIHIPLSTLLGNTDKLIGIIKHEEGHLYVSLDKEHFKEDFKNAEKLVDHYEKELSDHGNVPEEYVADLYSARTSGDNGKALIEFLKKAAIDNRKGCAKIKKEINKRLDSNRIRKIYSIFIEKNRKPLNEKENAAVNRTNGSNRSSKDIIEDYEESLKLLNSYLTDSEQICKNYCNRKGLEGFGKGSYSEQYANKSESKLLDKTNKILKDLKKGINNFESEMKGIIKLIVNQMPDIDSVVKAYDDAREKILNQIEDSAKAIDNEVRLRISFIKKHTGQLDNKKVVKEQFEDTSSTTPKTLYTNEPIQNNDTDPTVGYPYANKMVEEDGDNPALYNNNSSTSTPGHDVSSGPNGSINSSPMPLSAQTKTVIADKLSNMNNKFTKECGDNNCVKQECGDKKVIEQECGDKECVNQEGFFTKKPKRLKPIPRDIIPYITVSMNDIRDANDQAMLSGYTCSKIELVDFYITCLDTQDARYIVPHNRQYLENMKKELENLLTQILRIRPINRSDQIWRVNYPT